ncbi:MAG TPA: hypothetical protein VGL38_11910 [bacterium]|jgi:hypothetical protein
MKTAQYAAVTVLLFGLTAGNAQPTGGVAHVDNGTVPFTPLERNLMVASVMSELGQWKSLDSLNIKDKAIAISYVILRRTLNGTPEDQHTIKETVLAHNQFYGLTKKQSGSGRYKGKPEVHAALASLDPAYRQEILTRAKAHPSKYMREIVHLMPSDTTHGDDGLQFQRALRAAQAGVDAVLMGAEKDLSNGATFFGGVGDIYKSRDHQPSKIVAHLGGLGSFASIKALLADPSIHSSSHRIELRDKQGVDAIFFYK